MECLLNCSFSGPEILALKSFYNVSISKVTLVSAWQTYCFFIVLTLSNEKLTVKTFEQQPYINMLNY